MLNDAYPYFTQAQVAECTSADARTVENYVTYDYLRPTLMDGRRRFTLRQLLKVEFTFRLATVCKIAPKAGSQLADRILAQDRFGLVEDLEQPDQSAAWPRRTSDRLELIFDPTAPEDVQFTADAAARPDSIHLVFPARLFSRLVIQQAAPLMVGEE